MNKDIFFAAYIKDIGHEVKSGLAVRIPPEAGRLPGDRIKDLTEAVRKLSLQEGERLRTEMLVAPPFEVETTPLADYLWADGSVNAPRLVRHLETRVQGNTPHHFLPRCGVPVLGPELIGREQVLAKLEENLRNYQSCHLRAPRRYGKTSLLMRINANLPQTVMMELSDIGSLAGFLKVLLRGCMRHEVARACLLKLAPYRSWPADTPAASASIFNDAFGELTKLHGRTLPTLLRETLSTLAENGMVLLVDEFSVFLRNMYEDRRLELETFLEIFHVLRIRAAHPLVAVFAGSAGLSTYIQFHGLQALFADLVPVDVLPIGSTEARVLAEELFYGMGKRPSVSCIDQVIKLTGEDDTVPYFVHALAHATAEELGLRKEVLTTDVERAYYDRLLGPPGNIFFRDFILRERGYPAEYRLCASNILKTLSRKFPASVREEELQTFCPPGCDFIKIRTCLEEDYDLVRTEQGWRMRSRVLADRWRLGEPWLTLGGI